MLFLLLRLRLPRMDSASFIFMIFNYKYSQSLRCLPILPEEDRLEPRRMCIAVGSLSVAVSLSPTGVRNHSDLVRIRAACLSWTYRLQKYLLSAPIDFCRFEMRYFDLSILCIYSFGIQTKILFDKLLFNSHLIFLVKWDETCLRRSLTCGR